MLIGVHQREAEQRFATAAERLAWTGAAVNGAALIAFANIVGGVDHPDVALKALAIPIAIAGIGMVVGANAVQEAVAGAAAAMLEGVHRDAAERALEDMRLGPDLFTRPVEPEVAKYLFGEDGERRAALMMADALKRRIERSEQASENFKIAHEQQRLAGADRLESQRLASIYQRSAALLCGAAIAWAVVQSFLGVSLS